jgi:hypothetical protein
MNRIARELAQLPESSRALPFVFMFSAILMGALYWVRLGADLNFDGEIYISAAFRYAVGMNNEGLAIYPMPLYPYLISLMQRIIPDWVSAGRLISYFSITLAVIPLYRLSMDLFNRQAAFWSCLAFTLLPETLPFFYVGDLFCPKGYPIKRTHPSLGFGFFWFFFNPLQNRRTDLFSNLFLRPHSVGCCQTQSIQKLFQNVGHVGWPFFVPDRSHPD